VAGNVLELIKQGPLVLEGSMGWPLMDGGYKGANVSLCSATEPERVTAVHRGYREVGCELFQTNSFTGNRPLLRAAGAEDQCEAVWRGSVAAAREAIGDLPLAANLGPTGLILQPYGDTPAEECQEYFREQIAVQAEAGVDWVIIETMMSLEEMEAAILGAREAAPDLPLAATMSFDKAGRTQFGVTGAEAGERLEELGADIVGANCGLPEDALVGLGHMARATDRPLMVQLNAGKPELRDGKAVFPETPESYLEYVRRALELGVSIVGGCCGTTAEHMKLVVELVKG